MHISTLRAKSRQANEDLHKLRCDISRLVELAYPDDPPEILNRTARDFFVGALKPISLREKVLDLGPNSLDEALAAAQRYESNQKVLEKGSARVLTTSSAPFRQVLVLVLNRGLKSPHHGQETSFNSKLKFYKN